MTRLMLAAAASHSGIFGGLHPSLVWGELLLQALQRVRGPVLLQFGAHQASFGLRRLGQQ